MNWEHMMTRALEWSRRHHRRVRVYGVRVVDEAGLVAPCWVYRAEVTR